MFCRNCGHTMDSLAVVCVHCGVQAGIGGNFCGNCGHTVTQDQLVCIQCGAALQQGYHPPHTGYGGARPLKSRVAAGILGILLGSFGVHNFYLGFTGRAIAQLLITVLTCGIGAFISGIWGLVEGIMILTGQNAFDAEGLPLGD